MKIHLALRVKVDIHLRWLTTEISKLRKIKRWLCTKQKQVEDTKNNELRWLATDINLNCYTLGVLSLMIIVS